MKSGRTGVFQLGTGKPTSVDTLIAGMKAAVGNGFPITVRYEPFRSGELRHTWCDISNAREQLGYNPMTSLEQGLAQTWDWFFRGKA